MRKTNSRIYILFLTIFTVCTVINPDAGSAAVEKGTCTINKTGGITPLSGTWHFRYGDNPEWKEESFLPRKWQKATVPGWITSPKGKKIPGFFWYRLHIHVDKKALGDRPLFISLPRFFHASEIYFNGKLMGRRGRLPLKKQSFSWGVGGIYRIITTENIYFDRPNVLAVRVYGGYRIFAGSLYSYGFAGPYDYRKSFYWINNLMNLLLGGILFLIAVHAWKGFQEKKNPARMRIGTFSFFLGLFLLMVWMPDNIEGDTRFLHAFQTALLLGVLALLPTLAHGAASFPKKGRRHVKAFMILCAILGTTAVATRYFPLVNILLYGSLGAILLFVLTGATGAIILFFRGRKAMAPVAVAGLAVTAAMLVDLWRITGGGSSAGTYIIRMVTPPAAVLSIILIYLKTSPPEKKEKESPPGRSHLTGIDTDSLQETLQRMIKEDKIYQRDTLTLQGLAEELDITPHQLSEFLNKYRQQNFNSFINSYRIGEAQKILIREPGASIISIAYRVGFNSPSTFYDAFNKETGMKPGEYRKINS